MKIAIQNPTTMTLVEKIAALGEEVTVVGPRGDMAHLWDSFNARIAEWNRMGLKVKWLETPFYKIDYKPYDLLIHSTETFGYAKEWVKYYSKATIPTVLKTCWGKVPTNYLPHAYLQQMLERPVILEMPSHLEDWKGAGFTDVTALPNPVGDWWFEREWTGSMDTVLFVLAGRHKWRLKDETLLGLDWWERLCRIFPEHCHHHDGYNAYLTPIQMAEMFACSRVFVNLDTPFGEGERPLALAFTEALAAGMPVVARDLPGLDYKKFGAVISGFEELVEFVRTCLKDQEFASACSEINRETAWNNFSTRVLKPEYEAVFGRAK